MNTNYRQLLIEQIRRMRGHCVEPEAIHMSRECWRILGKPRSFSGIPVDCDGGLRSGFEVR